MDFLLLGSNYFRASLEAMGHQAVWTGTDVACDLQLPDRKLDIPYILSRLSARPQAIILTDDLGRRVFPSGLEKTDILKVWYAVDTPLNYFWQKEYAALFDLILADQQDKAEALARLGQTPVYWLPVGVDTAVYQGPVAAKRHDFGFVGSLNANVRPKRSFIISILSKWFRVKTTGGRQSGWVAPRDAAELYRQSRLVLNENLFNGVTTRMLEAMASGTALFSEEARNGLERLFTRDEDLISFNPENMLDQAKYYLTNDRSREKIAASGYEKVRSGHDIRHRTTVLLDRISTARPGVGLAEGGAFYRHLGKVLFLTGVRWPEPDGWSRLLRAETMLSRAHRMNEADAEALFYLGLVKKLKGDTLKSLACLESAVCAGSLRAGLALGSMAMENGKYFLARTHFLRALGRDNDVGPEIFQNLPRSPVLSADQHCALGQLLEDHGCDLTPGFSPANLDLSLWNALEHYQRAACLDRTHVQALTRLGRLLIRHGAYTEAHQFLARAAELNPELPELAEMTAQAARLGYVSMAGAAS